MGPNNQTAQNVTLKYIVGGTNRLMCLNATCVNLNKATLLVLLLDI